LRNAAFTKRLFEDPDHATLLQRRAYWSREYKAQVPPLIASGQPFSRLEADPIVLLVAARDGYESPLTDAGLPEHRLAPLDSVAAEAVLDAASPWLSVRLRDVVLRQAAGNPLALNELPRTVGKDDAGTASSAVLPLTERLERAFSRALNDLPKQTQLLLLIAALNDRESTGEILQAAALAAGRRIDLDALEPAALAGLIELDVSFVRFRHPLCAPRSGKRRRSNVDGAPTKRLPRRCPTTPTVASGIGLHTSAERTKM
jgi:hypothetical protein